MIGATLGVFSNSFSGLLSGGISPFGGRLGNDYFSGSMGNIIGTGANEILDKK